MGRTAEADGVGVGVAGHCCKAGGQIGKNLEREKFWNSSSLSPSWSCSSRVPVMKEGCGHSRRAITLRFVKERS